MSDALRRSDLLILTGGLGPTDDDLTRDVVADLIGRPLEYHAHIFEAIEKRFAFRGLVTPAINRRQAMVPAAPPCCRTRTERLQASGSSTKQS